MGPEDSGENPQLEKITTLETDDGGRVYKLEDKDNGNLRISVTEGDKEIGQMELLLRSRGDETVATIKDIGVNKEYRRQGIADRITDHAERVARAKGATEIGAFAAPGGYFELLKDKRGYNANGFEVRKRLQNSVS